VRRDTYIVLLEKKLLRQDCPHPWFCVPDRHRVADVSPFALNKVDRVMSQSQRNRAAN
jgi:hypothetical protein